MTRAHRELRRWLGSLGDLLVAQLQLRLQVLPRRPVPKLLDNASSGRHIPSAPKDAGDDSAPRVPGYCVRSRESGSEAWSEPTINCIPCSRDSSPLDLRHHGHESRAAHQAG